MPVSGLPTMLECIFNNILEESQLASYKIVVNQQQRTTLVLRFDARIDTSVSTIHHSSPADSFRRKSPSQLLRDRNRQHNHLSSLTTKKAEKTTLPLEKANIKSSTTDSTTDISVSSANSCEYSTTDKNVPALNSTDSTPDNVPLTVKSSEIDSVLDNSDHYNVDSPAGVTRNEHSSKGKVTECDTPCEDFVQLTNTHSTTKSQIGHEDIILSDSAYNEHTRSHDFNHNNESEDDEHNTDDSHEDDTSDTSDSDHSTSDRHDDDTLNTSDSALDERTREITPIIASQQEESDYASLCKKFLKCDKIQLQCERIMRDTGQYVTQPERNNNITKLLLDTYGFQHVLLAETEDLIVEYSANCQKIVNFIVKNSEHKSTYETMRLRHLDTWADMTSFIHSDYYEHVLNLMTALPILKRWIREASPQ